MGRDLEVSQYESLEALVKKLINANDFSERIELLQNTKEFQNFYRPDSELGKAYQEGTIENKIVIASILAIGEGPIVFRTMESSEFDFRSLEKLLDVLWDVELFYHEIGGIVGYHHTVLKLLHERDGTSSSIEVSESFLKPVGINLSHPGTDLNQYIKWGIEHLPEMAEIYPVGGAGDRLDLRDETTDEPLPAAELRFGGRTLLGSMIRDLQAKEYLYFKLFGKQLLTPIAMMTSEEKGNHHRIVDICKRNNWFGRGEENFFLFIQPLVPVITIDGHWSMSGAMELTLKPGGHGVIWKLAQDAGLFQWLAERNRKKALLRQINNPVAGTDSGVLAFSGIGCEKGKAFGFSSCHRQLNTSQGMVVLIKKESNEGYEYSTSNIEYTDFSKRGLEDAPETPGSTYSKFPANTNILFVDLKCIAETISHCPVPGMLVNFKNNAPFINQEGVMTAAKSGRLESTMQNISDHITDLSDHTLSDDELLLTKTFVTFNETRKTISVTKNTFKPPKPMLDTPEGCFYDVMQNNYDLFSKYCKLELPELRDQDSYIKDGPNHILLFNPALGPIYSVISQKVRGGRLFEGAEVQLEIAEVDIQNIEIDGSLIVETEQPLGHKDSSGKIIYSELSGKCELRNVRVVNSGISRESDNVYWKNKIDRSQKLHIVLKGNAEFAAENITFQGDYTIEVPEGYRWTAIQKGTGVEFQKEEITTPTWFWEYSFDNDNNVVLKKIRNES